MGKSTLQIRVLSNKAMSIADDLRAAIAAKNELDRKLARRIGEHIDFQAKSLERRQNKRNISDKLNRFAPSPFSSLPPATKSELNKLNLDVLKAIAGLLELKGRSKYKRKAELVDFLVSQKAPKAPGYVELLRFWAKHL